MTEEQSYFQERMDLLGVTPENNVIQLWEASKNVNEGNVLADTPIFTEVPEGIRILVYTLGRKKIIYSGNNSRWRNKVYAITRLQEPKVKKDGSIQKYNMPYNQQTHPFFPPSLVQKYDNKEQIPVLYLTEGYFKAYKAALHGIDCIGLPSITCMTDKETGKLHGDVLKIISTCQVKRLVWLVDGDCRDISTKEIDEQIDLYRRPRAFFSTISRFADLTSGLEQVEKYFAHINSENLDNNPKGLDDLLIAYPNELEAIKKEFDSFDKIQNGRYQGTYIVKMNITFSTNKVYSYFNLGDVTRFYLFHVEKRKDLQGKEFRFNGTLYKYIEEKGQCEVIIPKEAKDYFRVGDHYFQYVQIPDQYGELQKTYRRREKSTIKDDCGPNVFKHIPKYNEFCNVPDHLNYQRVIHNCFNKYFPFDHEPEEGECEAILTFLKHIFGTHKVEVTNKEGQSKMVEYWVLALDYLTILLKYPQQILPILSLVSVERQTGKTTFLKLLKLIFTENMAIVGNEDLAGSFNSHWASKLLIACDEAKIDKHVVLEKVKSFSTGNEIQLNAKGKDQFSLPFFGKFILCSNNEDNFINIDENEIRFWVLKVHRLPTKNVHLLDEMKEEIPAFIHLLNTRQLATEYQERHWFDTKLLKTEALEKLQKNSQPMAQQRLVIEITNLFEADEHRSESLTIPLKVIASDLLKKPADTNYFKRILQNMGYRTKPSARKQYPKLVEEYHTTNQRMEQHLKWISFHSSYYEFYRKDFVTDDDTAGTVTTDYTPNSIEPEQGEMPF